MNLPLDDVPKDYVPDEPTLPIYKTSTPKPQNSITNL